jgi:hypothetical protein
MKYVPGSKMFRRATTAQVSDEHDTSENRVKTFYRDTVFVGEG